MKKIATAFALSIFALTLQVSPISAQKQKPSAEYAAIWDATLNRWRDTVQTFWMSYTPDYTLTSKSGKYQTTYSGFVPVTSDVYQSRFYWEPYMTYSQVQIDSVHENGTLSPIRIDQYDRSIPRRTTYTRSMWDGSAWKPANRTISMMDTLGITRSVVNYGSMNGELFIGDSTHVDVKQDIKGNVTNVKVWKWTMADPTLKVTSEQRYTLNGDGTIAVAEIWNTSSGELAPALRLHSFDWAVRDKSFSYVQREAGSQLYFGGDGYRSAVMDLASGSDWIEYYPIQQSFDDQNRIISYSSGGMARDTFSFDNGLLTLNQHDEYFSSQWNTFQGAKTIYDRDANGTLRSVTLQKYDAQKAAYVNDRMYFYTFGAADVKEIATRSNISVYPNPSTDLISIESADPVRNVSVISATGAVAIESTVSQIDVSKLAPGMYSVRVQTSGGEETLKFVKLN
jgi:hypothetical protein